MSSWLWVLIIVAPAEPEIKSSDKKPGINLSVSCSLSCSRSLFSLPPPLSVFVLDQPYCCFIVTDDGNIFLTPWQACWIKILMKIQIFWFFSQSIKTHFMRFIVSSWFCVSTVLSATCHNSFTCADFGVYEY